MDSAQHLRHLVGAGWAQQPSTCVAWWLLHPNALSHLVAWWRRSECISWRVRAAHGEEGRGGGLREQQQQCPPPAQQLSWHSWPTWSAPPAHPTPILLVIWSTHGAAHRACLLPSLTPRVLTRPHTLRIPPSAAWRAACRACSPPAATCAAAWRAGRVWTGGERLQSLSLRFVQARDCGSIWGWVAARCWRAGEAGCRVRTPGPAVQPREGSRRCAAAAFIHVCAVLIGGGGSRESKQPCAGGRWQAGTHPSSALPLERHRALLTPLLPCSCC